MFNLYEQSTNTTIIMPAVRSVDEARDHANAAAELGHTAFYRVFKQDGAWADLPFRDQRETFVTAFLVKDGVVSEWTDVTFPPRDVSW